MKYIGKKWNIARMKCAWASHFIYGLAGYRFLCRQMPRFYDKSGKYHSCFSPHFPIMAHIHTAIFPFIFGLIKGWLHDGLKSTQWFFVQPGFQKTFKNASGNGGGILLGYIYAHCEWFKSIKTKNKYLQPRRLRIQRTQVIMGQLRHWNLPSSNKKSTKKFLAESLHL